MGAWPVYLISPCKKWPRCQPGNKPLSEPMLVSLLTHICVTWLQWVNSSYPTLCSCAFFLWSILLMHKYNPCNEFIVLCFQPGTWLFQYGSPANDIIQMAMIPYKWQVTLSDKLGMGWLLYCMVNRDETCCGRVIFLLKILQRDKSHRYPTGVSSRMALEKPWYN